MMQLARRRNGGFTLIELMIAVVILTILLAIAIPNYQTYRVKANRAAAQQFLMEISNKQSQYLLDNRGYASTLAALNLTLPSDLSGKYTISFPAADSTTFTARATPDPTGPQKDDGNIEIDHTGKKTGTW